MNVFSMIGALLLVCSTSALTAPLKTLEGKIEFSKGEYLIKSANQEKVLKGLDLQSLRKYEGRYIKVAGYVSENELEVYKIFVKTDSGYETTYDWDVVNQDLYLD